MHEYYAQHLSDYRVPDRVKVAQILFKTAGKTPPEVETIEKTAADVLNQIRAGANFGELAKKYSEDSTAQAGGELGWLVHGQTVPEFDSTAFSLKPGQVSGLVKTVYGIEILKVEDKQVAHLQSFDEVKDSIRTDWRSSAWRICRKTLATDLEKQLKANPQQFDEIVRKLGLGPQGIPAFQIWPADPRPGQYRLLKTWRFSCARTRLASPSRFPRDKPLSS